MITATCINPSCREHNVPYFVLGQPERVECGLCAKSTDLTDAQPDPDYAINPFGVNIQ